MADPTKFFSVLVQANSSILGFLIAFVGILYSASWSKRIEENRRLDERLQKYIDDYTRPLEEHFKKIDKEQQYYLFPNRASLPLEEDYISEYMVWHKKQMNPEDAAVWGGLYCLGDTLSEIDQSTPTEHIDKYYHVVEAALEIIREEGLAKEGVEAQLDAIESPFGGSVYAGLKSAKDPTLEEIISQMWIEWQRIGGLITRVNNRASPTNLEEIVFPFLCYLAAGVLLPVLTLVTPPELLNWLVLEPPLMTVFQVIVLVLQVVTLGWVIFEMKPLIEDIKYKTIDS